MGGPAARIFVPQPLSEAQIRQLNQIIDEISSSREGNDFWISDARSLGGSYEGIGLPFSFELHDPEQFFELKDASIIKDGFGFKPVQAIGLDCFTNGAEQHRILGLLTLHLSITFNGIISFDGALLPPLPDAMNQGIWFWEKANWSDVESYFAAMVKSMPGKIVSVKYEVSDVKEWAYHVANSEFMEAWLKHPNFHMIK